MLLLYNNNNNVKLFYYKPTSATKIIIQLKILTLSYNTKYKNRIDKKDKIALLVRFVRKITVEAMSNVN